MLCLDEEFYSLKILRHPREGLGAELAFIGIFFSSFKNKTNIPAMDPKHLTNIYSVCIFLLVLSALVLMSAGAILQYDTNHQENDNGKQTEKPLQY